MSIALCIFAIVAGFLEIGAEQARSQNDTTTVNVPIAGGAALMQRG